ncbi:alpha-glucosidase [Alloscardovia theropitheci]|uniref:Alpha-glucosidase n=1 Tax=Alloscardovia theropitheci TaxID=2496842 RepID=A0A4R0QQ63_9BIFI|nr:alpha-glucosidase [Alloscardovia theropitheci]TCD54424.1 alpha-glucosidase [Alloscardovia theropitheci]
MTTHDVTEKDSRELPWWSNAVVYQVYPRSFQDSDGDGMGDVPGITSRLPYLASLGVDVVWLSPVYKSPQDDNGYDISDYQDIDPMFGTLDDMDTLLKRAHELGLKVVMDLVVNHTSDEHDWFKASAAGDSKYTDWYIWEDPKPGHVGGQPGAEPNNWGSYFGGSAWQWVPERGQYYFHQFSVKQPDLNWENPAMRQAVYQMMNWWMDRGIDGFRMDVISYISKTYDENGRLPGIAGSLIPERPAGPDGFDSPFDYCSDGPHLDEILQEMHREVFDGRDGYLNVGEAPGISAERATHVTNPQNKELDMLFLIDHMGIDQHGPAGKWSVTDWKLSDLRKIQARYEQIIDEGGWTSLFFCNHDQPRVVSRWGDDSSEESRTRSAKALGLLLHMHQGTPYIYQGEELGMTNADYTSLDQYEDLESINMYHQLVGAGVLSSDEMMNSIQRMGRDNSRTPMQWDDSIYAGFESADAHTQPWLGVNANKATINAQAEQNDENSVFSFYQKLIALRHTNPIVSHGHWNALDIDDEQVYAFTRTLDDHELVVVINVSSELAALPTQTAAVLNNTDHTNDEHGDGLHESKVILSNDSAQGVIEQINAKSLNPWTAFVYEVK